MADIASVALRCSLSVAPAEAAMPAARLPSFVGHGTNTLGSSIPIQCGTWSSEVKPKIFIPLSFLAAMSSLTSSCIGMLAGP